MLDKTRVPGSQTSPARGVGERCPRGYKFSYCMRSARVTAVEGILKGRWWKTLVCNSCKTGQPLIQPFEAAGRFSRGGLPRNPEAA
jgi:hypothetical protein